MTHRMRWGTVALLLTLILVLSACQKSTSVTSTTTKPSSTQTKTKTQPTTQKTNPSSTSTTTATPTPAPTKPQKVYPLTGLPAKGPINNRVFGVMINNYYLARPQSGLQKADIVYEVLTEGRITRFLALFQSQKPNIIGPVRSMRPYFAKLDEGYGGIYSALGWSPQAQALLKKGGIDYIQGLFHDGTWFYRVNFRKAPHNAYTTYDNLVKGAKTKGYSITQNVKPLPFLNKDQINQLQGSDVNKVTITYGKDNVVSYVYNPDKRLFYRHINGQQAADRETKTPLTAANVFIISAKHTFIDSYPRRAIDLQSGGPGYLLQHGKVQKVEWKNVNGRILPYKNGKALGFVPGQTWINIVEANPGLDKEVKLELKGS